MFAASKTDSVSGAGPEDKFNYVTMLLHGDGTNGAQNNTFLDSSTNNFTITRNGNTTQGSFSPYGSNWSNFFPSSSYLEIANNTALQMSTGDFTIEFWLNFSSLSNYQTIFTKGYTAAGGLLVQTNTGTGTLLIYAAGSVVITASSASTLGTWNHYALVRNSGTLTLYLNGTSVGSASNSTNFNNTESFNVGGSVSGYYTNGYISNFRVVKGTAVYTGSFTPSTTPFTAITNTQLLVCQSNRFVDNSANAFSSTITGTPSVQRFNPFGTSTAYSTSVIGGSGYSDGTGDYLTVADNAALNFSTGSFTIEGWVFLNAYPSSNVAIASKYNAAAPYNGWVLQITTSGYVRAWIGTSYLTTSASTLALGTWNHLAMVRNGSAVTVYINGVSAITGTSSVDVDNTGICYIASEDGSGSINGYITNVRVVKGTAVYTAAFTPPTTPLTAVSGTSLLLNFTNAAIFDNAMMNDLETVGNAQISTSVKKYGTGSLAFDGTGDWLTVPTSQNFAPGVGDWTIECWLYPISGNWAIVTGSNFYINNNSGTVYVGDASVDIIAVSPPSTGVWTHIAVTKSGSTVRLFYDGTQVGSSTTALSTAITTSMVVGGRPSSSISTNGYIDDLRITKGYARYTATFTPPTSALSDTGPY